MDSVPQRPLLPSQGGQTSTDTVESYSNKKQNVFPTSKAIKASFISYLQIMQIPVCDPVERDFLPRS